MMKKLVAALMVAGTLVLGSIAAASTQAGQPHGKACAAHGKAGQHGQGATHGKSGQPHGKKCDSHGKAGQKSGDDVEDEASASSEGSDD